MVSHLAIGVAYDTAVVGHIALDVLHSPPDVADSTTLRHARREFGTFA